MQFTWSGGEKYEFLCLISVFLSVSLIYYTVALWKIFLVPNNCLEAQMYTKKNYEKCKKEMLLIK